MGQFDGAVEADSRAVARLARQGEAEMDLLIGSGLSDRQRRRWHLASFVLLVICSVDCRNAGSTPDNSALDASTSRSPDAATAARAATDDDDGIPAGADDATSAEDAAASARRTVPQNEAALTGSQLYAAHCAACHGETGDGKGVAATFLFPKPRDLRAGNFRLVSTDNNVPTRDDLHSVLLRGMPGSAMPPWEHLSQSERNAIVDFVMQLRSEGARETYTRQLREVDELTDEEIESAEVRDEIDQHVRDFTTPGASTDVPAIEPATDESVARGREVYAKYACTSCHGTEGKGDGAQEMTDIEQLPTRPRDFTLGIFKGNPAPASLYRRIAYGMPGTPMPGSSTMTPDQRIELVHYVLSLSTEGQREAAVLNREKMVVVRVEQMADAEHSGPWEAVAKTPLRMAPIWWRNDADPGLVVQAIHDGQTLAIRLTWRDATPDRSSVRTEAFRDAAAVELYRGKAEPFLGMGAMNAPVELWFWDADHQDTPATVEEVHPNMIVDNYPFSETVVASAEINRTGARSSDQPDVSLPSRASGNPIVPVGGESGGSLLAAVGPGSVTSAMELNRSIWARGTWSEGQWTVLLKRPLLSGSEKGSIALAPGEAASIAFAIWDGASRDRDGQKSITIWQDLELED